MQNLKSLDNLIQKPVLGANDDIWSKAGRRCVELYSWEEQTMDMLKEVDEPLRKALSRELLTDSKQD
jgi:hypothetical protein